MSATGREFVMGDIHGGARAVEQCMGRAAFDVSRDRLICLGDVCDGWPETSRAIDLLLAIPKLTYLLGNHDFWTLTWMKTGNADRDWLEQGGRATIASYSGKVPAQHVNFLKQALPYFETKDRLFVHAGFNPDVDVKVQALTTLLWDRTLAQKASLQLGKNYPRLTRYNEVFVGHSPHTFDRPVCGGGVWLMDTGAGWRGRLSMMNLATREVFVSDPLPELYPGTEGRKPRT